MVRIVHEFTIYIDDASSVPNQTFRSREDVKYTHTEANFLDYLDYFSGSALEPDL